MLDDTIVNVALPSGTGTGLTFVGCTVTGMREVAPGDSGVAAGLLNTSVQVGSALGLGAVVAICTVNARISAAEAVAG